MKKLLLVLFIFFANGLYHIYLRDEWEGQVFVYDASGYYLYLPASFIYHDVGELKFYPHIDSVYKPSPDGRTWYGLFEQPAPANAWISIPWA